LTAATTATRLRTSHGSIDNASTTVTAKDAGPASLAYTATATAAKNSVPPNDTCVGLATRPTGKNIKSVFIKKNTCVVVTNTPSP